MSSGTGTNRTPLTSDAPGSLPGRGSNTHQTSRSYNVVLRDLQVPKTLSGARKFKIIFIILRHYFPSSQCSTFVLTKTMAGKTALARNKALSQTTNTRCHSCPPRTSNLKNKCHLHLRISLMKQLLKINFIKSKSLSSKSFQYLSRLHSEHGVPPHDPEIKSHMLP